MTGEIVKPIYPFVLVKLIERESPGGIILAPRVGKAQNRADAIYAEIISVNAAGEHLSFSAGNHVYIAPGAGYAVQVNGDDCLLVETDSVLAFVTILGGEDAP